MVQGLLNNGAADLLSSAQQYNLGHPGQQFLQGNQIVLTQQNYSAFHDWYKNLSSSSTASTAHRLDNTTAGVHPAGRDIVRRSPRAMVTGPLTARWQVLAAAVAVLGLASLTGCRIVRIIGGGPKHEHELIREHEHEFTFGRREP